MKRNFDLIRELLLRIEASEYPLEEIEIEGFSKIEILYNLNLLLEAGLIKGMVHASYDHSLQIVRPDRLTWEGHDFLDAARNKNIWAKAKQRLNEKLGSVPFDVLKGLLVQLAKSAVMDG
jgi:hypothetical protein